jgi:ATP-dependent DNA helicase PIF1
MTQAQALDILKTGANVFLTGEPGAGKTHTINQYASYLRTRNIEPAITASTGIAATHLGGMTIHSWSGIGIKKYLDKYELDKISSTEYVAKRIRRCKVLIIDEVSMLSPETLDMADAVCRTVRQNNDAFGGLQVIFVGDFFQLPPIVRNEVQQNSQASMLQTPKARFAYDSSAWHRAKPMICYLSEQHRQDDDLFLGILSAIRSNSINDGHLSQLNKRKVTDSKLYEKSVKLYTHNLDVDKTNDAMLATVVNRPVTFEMKTKGAPALIAALQKGCLSPATLILKVGAKVMFTKNNPKAGFVNGTLGTVESFDNYVSLPAVRTTDGRRIVVEPMDWSVEENGKPRATITQVPLRLAWAITVHKSQGMSLEEAVMDLSDVFEFGQGYVALSRVRRLTGLYLLGWNEQTFKVHPEVLEKDKDFKINSQATQLTFAKVPKEELAAMHKNFIKACSGDAVAEDLEVPENPPGDSDEEIRYTPITGPDHVPGKRKNRISTLKSKAFQKMKEKYPNAHKAWTPSEDAELREFFASGVGIEEIAQTFNRKPGAVQMRLAKLGLLNEI